MTSTLERGAAALISTLADRSGPARMLGAALAACLMPAALFGQSLTTTFAGGDKHDGNMFDIQATNQVTITNFDVHYRLAGGSSGTIEVYYVPGGWLANANNAAAWTLVGSTPLTGNTIGIPTPLPLPINVTIPAGQTYGFYITNSNFNDPDFNDTLGTGVTYSNADVTIFEGSGVIYPFLGNFTPRTWNGTVYYTTGNNPCTFTTYCTPQQNSLACTPAIGATGSPSLSATTPFTIRGSSLLPNVFGRFFYSKSGQANTPFMGGTLCAQAPLRFLPVAKSSAGAGCSGVIQVDFSAWMASGADPALVAGQKVNGQFHTRDQNASLSTNLTNAIEFTVCP